MSYNPAVPVLVVVAFGCLVYFGSQSRSSPKGNQVPLAPTDSTWTGTRSHDDHPEGDIEVTAPSGDRFRLSLYAGGVPYQDRTQRDANAGGDQRWTYKYTVHRYILDFGTDLGAWAGFRATPAGSADSGFDVGIRYSPIRVGYGVVSPDVLFSPRQAGVGVSLYAPAQSVPVFFQRLGVGVGYLADYRGGSSGWAPYLSLSTRY